MRGDPEDITAWQRLDERITTSGRLTEADPARLAAIGVRRVINLALTESPGALAGEAELLADEGVAYTHIPVRFDAPEEAQFEAFVAALEAETGPLHIHCIMNWRVSAFFYRYHRDRRGMAEPAARALMERQWTPETHANPAAPAWARFIAAKD